jgi:hypothetical protein
MATPDNADGLELAQVMQEICEPSLATLKADRHKTCNVPEF